MYLIKLCPSCNRKLRFPIDKGKIQIKCSCGNQFIADPDDPELFIGSQFDLSSGNQRGLKTKIADLQKKMDTVSIKSFYKSIIISLLDFKYKLQNFKLLPTSQQIKIIFILFIVILTIASVIYLLFHTTNVINDDPFVV